MRMIAVLLRCALATLMVPMTLGNAPAPVPRAPAVLEVGQPAPPFALTTLDNKAVELKDLRGQVVLINLWASWCRPCKGQMPVLDRYFRANRARGLQIFDVEVGVSVGPRRLRAISKPFAYPLVFRFRGELYVGFKSLDWLPTSFVIDRAGILRHTRSGSFSFAGLGALLDPLLAELPPADAAPH